jgi:hypothetical protein
VAVKRAYTRAGFPKKLAVTKGMHMKVLSLALITSLAVGGFANAQTPPPASAPAASAPAASAPAASAPAASSSKSTSVSRDCRREARKLCGMEAHGTELQGCIKSNLDLNKFSATCATQFKNAAAAKKPSTATPQ